MIWEPIDGETPVDPSQLRDKTITNRPQLNQAEAEAIRPVILKYLAKKPSKRTASFEYSWFLELHGEMYRPVWLFAGETRQCDLNLGVPWHQVQQSLMQLVGTLKFWSTQTEMPLIEQAARLHYEAVRIHPFENGNGRWSRMLADILLIQNGSGTIQWPANLTVESPIRSEYIAALKRIDQKGDWHQFVELHERHQEREPD